LSLLTENASLSSKASIAGPASGSTSGINARFPKKEKGSSTEKARITLFTSLKKLLEAVFRADDAHVLEEVSAELDNSITTQQFVWQPNKKVCIEKK
jgi:hypothetical protein